MFVTCHSLRLAVRAARALVTGCLAVLCAGHGVATAETVRVPADARDCAIRNGTSATTNYCTATTLAAGSASTRRQRSLLYFAVAGNVPPGMVVTDARLSLYQSARTTTASVPLALHGALQSWTSAATWNRYDSTRGWSSPGGDYGAAAVATSNSRSNAGFVDFPVTDMVQQWADDATSNRGLVLKQANEGAASNELTFASANSSTTSQRPYLDITYRKRASTDSSAADMVFPMRDAAGAPALWRSKSDGSGAAFVATGDYGEPALSPDGKLVAYTDGDMYGMNYGNMYVRRLGQDKPELLWARNGRPEASMPSFAPDGKHIAFVEDGRLWEIPTNGGQEINRTPDGLDGLVSIGASYSPDGQQIALSAALPGPNANYALYVANSDRTGVPRRVTEPSVVNGVGRPRFSRDGRTLLFDAVRPGGSWHQIFTVPTAGGPVTQLTNADSRSAASGWTSDGSKVLFSRWAPGGQVWLMEADGSNQRQILTQVDQAQSAAVAPQADKDALLATSFRPVLAFTGGEHWRPLDIPHFLGESHRICRGASACDPAASTIVTTPDDLANYPFPDARIDIEGRADHPEDYQSPSCGSNGTSLYDCDIGPDTSYYYNIARSSGGYTYLDYWFFYRYNEAPDASGALGYNHEGDWESVSVAPSRDASHVEFASFSEHGKWFSYLASNLTCGANWQGPGSCSATGQRVLSYVARGTHANYAQSCDGIPTLCWSHASGAPDGPHNGETLYGRNDESSALARFPQTAPAGTSWNDGPRNWTDWPGRWGSGGEVASPGSQSHFATPWQSSCADTNCPHERRAGTSRSQVRDARTGGCRTWFGSDVAALACDRRTAEAGVRGGRVGHAGAVTVTVGRKRAATGQGLAQLMGSPLAPGQRVHLAARQATAIELFVRVRDRGGRVYDVAFPPVALGRARTAVVTVGARLADRRGTSARLMTDTGTAVRPVRVARVGKLRAR